MKSSWPRVECRVTREFKAQHSLPLMGRAELHSHNYVIQCGYSHEINPTLGATHPLSSMLAEVDAVIGKIADKNLNEILPVTPTAEFLACWILSQLAPYWDFVILRCYEVFECRVDRHNITSKWLGICEQSEA